jgi:hypothetical protein
MTALRGENEKSIQDSEISLISPDGHGNGSDSHHAQLQSNGDDGFSLFDASKLRGRIGKTALAVLGTSLVLMLLALVAQQQALKQAAVLPAASAGLVSSPGSHTAIMLLYAWAEILVEAAQVLKHELQATCLQLPSSTW